MNDLPDLLRLGRMMHAESRYRFIAFDDRSVVATAVRLIQRGEGYASLAGEPGKAWAFIVGAKSSYYFAPFQHAHDLALFVDPARRRTWESIRVIRAFKDGFRAWAKMQGCVELTMGTTTGVHAEATAKLYERLGMERVGSIFKERLR